MVWVSKPPALATSLAPTEAAAMTDGSSTAMGTAYRVPLTMTLRASPKGTGRVPMQFSTITLAVASAQLSALGGGSSVGKASASRRFRSSIDRRWKSETSNSGSGVRAARKRSGGFSTGVWSPLRS